ncbi:unnamed protein product, partial [Discosporangium mesarthrocarpum]
GQWRGKEASCNGKVDSSGTHLTVVEGDVERESAGGSVIQERGEVPEAEASAEASKGGGRNVFDGLAEALSSEDVSGLSKGWEKGIKGTREMEGGTAPEEG